MNECKWPRCYIGTYSDAIYCWSPGERLCVAAEFPKPSFLALHPNGGSLYAVAEQRDGAVGAWTIEAPGARLRFLNKVRTGGSVPCHIALNRMGTVAAVCNYGTGTVAAIRVRPDGSLGDVIGMGRHSGSGPSKPRQSQPHPHGTFFSPDGGLAVVPDLGLDKLFLHHLDEAIHPAAAEPICLTSGSGPRHAAFHPSGAFVYVLCELDSTIVTLRRDGSSLTTMAARSVLPPGFSGESIAAAVVVDRNGRFLYCSNRGADTIAAFSIGMCGDLEVVEHLPCGGTTPRHIAIDDSGRWLYAANQGSDAVVVFRRDLESGKLLGLCDSIGVHQPACTIFLPDGNQPSPDVNCGSSTRWNTIS